VATIPAIANDPGLIAYECAGCGYLTSMIVDPSRQSRPTARRSSNAREPVMIPTRAIE